METNPILDHKPPIHLDLDFDHAPLLKSSDKPATAPSSGARAIHRKHTPPGSKKGRVSRLPSTTGTSRLLARRGRQDGPYPARRAGTGGIAFHCVPGRGVTVSGAGFSLSWDPGAEVWSGWLVGNLYPPCTWGLVPPSPFNKAPSRRGPPHRRTESIASVTSAASIADINIEETKTKTGMSIDDIAAFIQEPDPSDGSISAQPARSASSGSTTSKTSV
ncbi:hypothetical protein CHGG_09784 [Chaetomium globosum CBS 148.51]|uniref:Uncharacterized protein n=1 Tax=Chaetomium globosum (strain ATCC 6205 / CBS 148.51 / DSM 1962 / NBRC 6347 / NRRL 1970) TaxID=306901 RepID=Q2GQH0_CHAGB|nr:uncharacterized protein CHGG_09784 [Chaetomium globosum CBS 148.51]EAQ83380.1 hypothetical protein CHGG_09784 [Chaetomium globosum CBS 148.51]